MDPRDGPTLEALAAQVEELRRSCARLSHPKGSKQGDLYADKSGRLWFCKKGGTTATWHQIA